MIEAPTRCHHGFMGAAVGVDGCSAGWIAVVLRPGERAQAHFLARIDELAAAVPDAAMVGVDIPIGLPNTGRRQADVQTRLALGPRRSSIFFAPVRAALAAATHAAGTAASVRLTGSGMSRQSFALAAKIFEVEEWLPRAPCPVHEVHPELSFATMLCAPAAAGKKSWAGMIQRREILDRNGIRLDYIDSRAAVAAATDDMLDAGAAAWTAIRLQAGTAGSLPDPPETDGDGREMAIWF